jgi:hypothetical protein
MGTNKFHGKDRDQFLDKNGPNQVTSAEVKEAVDRETSGHIQILPSSYDSISQGSWSIQANKSNCIFNGYTWNPSAADGDSINYKVSLDKGTYTLKLLVVTSNSRGIIDIDIDGNEVASFDCYSASGGNNISKVQTGIVVSASGMKELKIRIDGKNASSTAHYATIQSISLWRTA